MKSPCYDHDLAVIGGDMRQVYLVEMFVQSGKQVCHHALCQATDKGHCIDTLSEVCSAAPYIICLLPSRLYG